jgi:hypothetical protein
MDVAIIEEEALRLPEGQRALLADRLMESLIPVSDEMRSAWIAEADSRMQAFREGKITSTSGSEAIAELRSRLGR